MLAGIREILVISTPQDTPRFEALLGDGSSWGIDISATASSRAPTAWRRPSSSARDFVGGGPSALVLGDNIFYGHDLHSLLRRADAAQTRRDGLRLPRARPRALRRRRVRRRPARAQHRGKAGAAEEQLRGHRPLLLRRAGRATSPPASSRRRAASSRSPTSTRATSRRASCTSRSWAAAMPGSTPAPTTACSRPASSSPRSRSARA